MFFFSITIHMLLKQCYVNLWIKRIFNFLFSLFLTFIVLPDICYILVRTNTSLLSLVAMKCPLFGLRQFLTIESSLKIMKNPFYFVLKALFALKVFTFLCGLFGYVEIRLDKKTMVHFKIYDVTD